MSGAEGPAPGHDTRRDGLFKLVLSSLLFVYLGFVLATLLSDVYWLAQPSEAGGGTNFSALGQQPLFRREVTAALLLSLETSLCTTALAMLVAIPSAYALSRFRFRFSSVLDTLIDLPIVVPPLLAGISLLLFFKQTPLGRFAEHILGDIVYTRRAIVVAQFFIAAAFGIRAVKAAFDSINPRFEAVARSLGCSAWQALFKVSLPLAKTGIVAGALLAWAR